MEKMVFIQSARLAGHFRAGRKFTREGGVFTVDAFTEKEWAAIRADKFLVVRDAEPADDALTDGAVDDANQTSVGGAESGELASLSTSTSTVLSTTDSAVASLSTATKSTPAKAAGAKTAGVKK